MAVTPIPEGYHSLTPYLIIKGAARALEFYTKAFGAKEVFRLDGPDGTIGHAEMRIGNSHFMLADEAPEMHALSPTTLGGSPIGLMIYTENCDAMFAAAVAAGARVDRDLRDQFYGDRSGTVIDPFGHKWTVATHVEDVSPQEMEARVAEYMKQQAGT
jgi:PhnB protein